MMGMWPSFGASGRSRPVLSAGRSASAAITEAADTVVATGNGDLRDGPGNAIYVPTTAAMWAALGLPAPDALWNCQDTTGALAAAIGANTLPTIGTADYSYQNTVTSWTRKFVGLTDGSTGHFEKSTTALDPGLSQSFCFMFLGAVAVNASTRGVFQGYDNNWGIRVQAVTGLIVANFNNVTAFGLSSLKGVATVQPILYGRNCTAGTCDVFTDSEHIAGTFSGVAITGSKETGIGINAIPQAALRCGQFAFWIGTNAELILAKTTLTTLGWTLAY